MKFVKLYDVFDTYDNKTVYQFNEIHHHVVNRCGLAGSFSFVLNNEISKRIPIWNNYEMVTFLVKMNGMLLKFADRSIVDEELCFNAVLQTGSALRYVPEPFINERICNEAIRKYNWIIKQEKNVTNLIVEFYKPPVICGFYL